MEKSQAVKVLSALANETRLKIVQLLERHDIDGLDARGIASILELSTSCVLANLRTLMATGLVTETKDPEGSIYSIDTRVMSVLVEFLLDDCCGGHPERCRIFKRDAVPHSKV